MYFTGAEIMDDRGELAITLPRIRKEEEYEPERARNKDSGIIIAM